MTIFNRRVIVSAHAMRRAEQRLGLMLRQHEKADIETFLKKELLMATEDIQLQNCPFYVNKMGGGITVYKTRFVKFFTIGNDDAILIKTVVKNRGEWRY